MPSENNKRIAKNTLFLYFRMMLTMGVSLYTSRVVLTTLGVEDYGIYNIVGGIIVIFGFLNGSMGGATSRFLTFELGRGDYDRLKRTFSASLTVHFIIAGIIFLLGETIGLWWLENKLVVPLERMNAARWVYQLSIFSSMIGITQVPYNASIIAHERMNIYAYVEILNSLLKLGIVYLLVIGHFDKLILYAILTFFVTATITSIYNIYCMQNFSESHYKFVWDKDIIHPMLSFSGWYMYSSIAGVAQSQGVNMILNLFFGVIMNAAYGISSQIQGIISQFSNNFLNAVRPQIMKFYAAKEIKKMQNLIINATKFSFLLSLVVMLPLIIENHFVFQLWLKKVPEYAVVFTQLNMVYSLFASFILPVWFGILATGKIKSYNLVNGTLCIIILPISYFLLRMGLPPTVPFIVSIVFILINCLVNIVFIHLLIPEFSIAEFLQNATLKSMVVGILSLVLPLFLHIYIGNEGWVRLIAVVLSSTFSIFLLGYWIILDKEMKKRFKCYVYSKILLNI